MLTSYSPLYDSAATQSSQTDPSDSLPLHNSSSIFQEGGIAQETVHAEYLPDIFAHYRESEKAQVLKFVCVCVFGSVYFFYFFL